MKRISPDLANSFRSSSRFKSGFSLPELIIIVLIISVLSSISAPIFLGIVQRERLRVAQTEAGGFIQNVRLMAMANSIDCLVSISAAGVMTATEPGATGSSPRCTPTGLAAGSTSLSLRTEADDNSLVVSITSGGSLGFSFKGTSLSSANNEVLITSPNAGGYTHCILVSSPIGFVKFGIRRPNDASCSYISVT